MRRGPSGWYEEEVEGNAENGAHWGGQGLSYNLGGRPLCPHKYAAHTPDREGAVNDSGKDDGEHESSL